MRILGITSYNGTKYQGWQKQPNGASIQETIEQVLINGEPIKLEIPFKVWFKSKIANKQNA